MIEVSDSLLRIDRQTLYRWLNDTYWARHRDAATIDTSLENSLCLSAWEGDVMVGFARVVTDYATFAWLCDVFVDPDHRGKGVAKLLVADILSREEFRNVRWLLGTRDAHGLYEQFGFVVSSDSGRWMTKNFNSIQQNK